MSTGATLELEELLTGGLAQLGYQPASDTVARLLRYVAEIELWNPRLKLVAASGRELVVRHVLDSLAGAAAILGPSGADRPGVRQIADLGSGAGLPGIPIAIVYPHLRVDLVERSGRRVGFLRNAVAATRSSNATVHELDATAYRGPADLVVFRAFVPLTAELLAAIRPALREGGAVCAYKGRREAIDAELSQLATGEPGSGAPAPQVIPVTVPFTDEERHLVVLS